MMSPNLPENRPEALDDSLFSFLARYHYNRNLKRSARRMKDGRVMYDGSPVEEGEENQFTQGLLIIKDGDNLEQIIDDYVEIWHFDDEAPDLDFTDLDGMDLEAYLRKEAKYDGAFLMDDLQISKPTIFRGVVRAAIMKYGIPSLARRLPADFIHASNDYLNPRNLGTKTRLAIAFPTLYDDLKAYQVKRTAFTDLGIGKVTRIGSGGIEQEFFFEDASNYAHTYDLTDFLFNEEHSVVGRLKTYRSENGSVTLDSDQLIKPGWVLNPI